jgi:hypothetical protein
MPSAVNRGSLDELRQRLEFVLENFPADRHPALAEATRGLMAGIDYRGQALLGSHWQAMREAIVNTANEEIEKHIQWARLTRQLCETVRTVDGSPGEEFDRLGTTVAAVFEKLLGSITRLKDRWVALAHECGMEVVKERDLEATVRELTALRESLFESWPWTSRGLPPVDRAMVERSRAAAARGEGEAVEHIIRRLSGQPTKG